jgi:hypothetical protein
MAMVPCTWCRDGTMWNGAMTCVICDGKREFDDDPGPPCPEYARQMEAIRIHCDEWRAYHEQKTAAQNR